MTIEATSMENSTGSIVDYSSEIDTTIHTKAVDHGYSSMEDDEEDADCKVEVVESVYAMSSGRSDDEWVKPAKNEKPSTTTPDKKHICGRLSVVAIHSPGRDGGASSSEASPGGSPSRSCTQCGATKTPLWRNGPSGPKSLCNACGIRYKKVGGTKRTTTPTSGAGIGIGTGTETGHDSSGGKSSSKSPKRKAEADPAPAGPPAHRRSKLVSSSKRPEDSSQHHHHGSHHGSHHGNHHGSHHGGHHGKAHEASSSKAATTLSSPVGSNVPRRVVTRRTTFYTPKWGARSARLRKSESKDEEEQEGAALLMALACGMVNA